MQIYMLITDRCNLNCKMCIRGKNKGLDIDYNIFSDFSFINELSESEVVITGGEPTIHENFIDIVEHTCKFAKNVAVTTNGTLDYYIEPLKNKKNLIFQVSLDGHEEVHDNIRGYGSYKKTINTLKKLDCNKVKYSVASVVNKKNKDSIIDLIPILDSLENMRYWRISYEMPFGNADFDNMMSAKEWNDFVDFIIKRVNFRLKIQKIFPFELYDKKMKSFKEDDLISKRCFNCGSGRDKIYVYPDLNVYSCTCLTDFCIGNLQKDSLKEILFGDKIKIFSNYKVNEETPCRECKYYKFCNGGCIGMSYHVFGKLGKGDIRCPILRRYYDKKNILF